MNLLIDSGNTYTKAALYENTKPIKIFRHVSTHEWAPILNEYPVNSVIISSVNKEATSILNHFEAIPFKLILHHTTPIPIPLQYSTPHTLGMDRLAAACGASSLFPNEHCLIIDTGTCITYDLLHKKLGYLGGSISPGIQMRFKALHTFTAQLPLVEKKPTAPLTGNSTEESILSGVLNGVLQELNGIIIQYQQVYSPLNILITGGDMQFFETNLKQHIFALPNLVFDGLNTILNYNATLKK